MPPRSIPSALLVDFLAGDPVARARFPEVAYPYLLKRAARHAPDLAEDLRGDIVQQAFAELMRLANNVSTLYSPVRATPETFLDKVVLRTAVRTVRASYCRPGHRTRFRRKAAEHQNWRPELLGLEEADRTLAASAGCTAIEVRCEVRGVVDRAPAMVGEALVRVHVVGDHLRAVAADMGVHRSKLSRAIAMYLAEIRVAA